MDSDDRAHKDLLLQRYGERIEKLSQQDKNWANFVWMQDSWPQLKSDSISRWKTAWRQERDKEKANRVAQQVRRAGSLTAELAAQSEKKVSVVCDQPPGLCDEPAVHMEAPDMGAGGSHPQAKMMQEASAVPLAASNFAATPAVSSPFLETQSFRPAGKGVLNLEGRGLGARSWSVLEVQDAAALVEETAG